MKSANPASPDSDQIQAARRLWFGGFQGMLSTTSSALPGYPFGSLVPVCRDQEGLPLLLLSHLAQHTKNLLNDHRCSLMLVEEGRGDVQQLGRLTCLALAEPLHAVPSSLSQRYFRYFPDTRNYFEALNFHFYRLIPQRCYFIGGFGAARWLEPSRLLPAHSFTEDEESLLLNQLESNPFILNRRNESLSLVGVDPFGLDLSSNHRFSRIMLSEPSKSPEPFATALEQAYSD